MPDENQTMMINQPLSKRIIGLVLGGVILAVALAFGSYHFFSSGAPGKPMSPERAKKEIGKFLRERSGQGDFKTEIPDSLVRSNTFAGVARSRSGRRRAVMSSQNEATRNFREQVKQAPEYRVIYRLIGEQLWIADQLQQRNAPNARENAVILAAETTRAALEDAVNGWLAARIVEGYILPFMAQIESDEATPVDIDYLARMSESAFRSVHETNNVIRTYKLLIEKSDNRKRADNTRYRLARILENRGDYRQALDYLVSIQDTNSQAVKRRIASVQQKLDK